MRTCQKRWTIVRRGERGSGISELAPRHDDDDDIYIYIYIYIYICTCVCNSGSKNTRKSSISAFSYPNFLEMLKVNVNLLNTKNYFKMKTWNEERIFLPSIIVHSVLSKWRNNILNVLLFSINTHTHTHTHKRIYIYIYIYIYKYIYIYIYICLIARMTVLNEEVSWGVAR